MCVFVFTSQERKTYTRIWRDEAYCIRPTNRESATEWRRPWIFYDLWWGAWETGDVWRVGFSGPSPSMLCCSGTVQTCMIVPVRERERWVRQGSCEFSILPWHSEGLRSRLHWQPHNRSHGYSIFHAPITESELGQKIQWVLHFEDLSALWTCCIIMHCGKILKDIQIDQQYIHKSLLRF